MKKIKLLVLLIVWCVCFKKVSLGFLDFLTVWNKPNIDRSIVYDFAGLVGRHNYPAEEHRVKTADGYKLLIHRIPGTPTQSEPDGKPVVFLQHGVLGSSDMFVLAGPNRDLAFLLADAGYDVWLGNARGNVYSRKHERLNPDTNPEFWDFSFHEIGIYDLSATINCILDKTNQSSLVYIGHSMGSSESLVLLSEKPRFNKKIHLVINMAPVYQWSNLRNFIKFLKHHWLILEELTFLNGLNEILSLSRIVGQKAKTVCNEGSILQDLCVDLVQYASGFDKEVMDIDLLVESFSYFPAGSSRRSFIHKLQNMQDRQFQMFDYGMIQNFMIYRQPLPPAYDLSKITTPVFMFYGLSDAVSIPEEALALSKVLKNATAIEVPHKGFSHMDFFWAKNAKGLLYDRILEIIAEHTSKEPGENRADL